MLLFQNKYYFRSARTYILGRENSISVRQNVVSLGGTLEEPRAGYRERCGHRGSWLNANVWLDSVKPSSSECFENGKHDDRTRRDATRRDARPLDPVSLARQTKREDRVKPLSQACSTRKRVIGCCSAKFSNSQPPFVVSTLLHSCFYVYLMTINKESRNHRATANFFIKRYKLSQIQLINH